MNSMILLVEDEDDLASIVEYHLTKAGYTVLRAANGQNALDILESTEVSLVLLDLMLPDMSGVDICRHIRSHTSWNSRNHAVCQIRRRGSCAWP